MGRRMGRSAALAGSVALMMVWPLAREAADEPPPDDLASRAVAVIRSIQAAQANYRSVYGYYDRLECLVQASCVPVTHYPPNYLSSKAMRPIADGYRFRFHDGDPLTATGIEPTSGTALMGFAVTAVPLDVDEDRPALCGDSTSRVYATLGDRQPAVRGGDCVDRTRPVEAGGSAPLKPPGP